ncbi:hypothetical protein PCE1_000666 [Barthelona sp. PCE]
MSELEIESDLGDLLMKTSSGFDVSSVSKNHQSHHKRDIDTELILSDIESDRLDVIEPVVIQETPKEEVDVISVHSSEHESPIEIIEEQMEADVHVVEEVEEVEIPEAEEIKVTIVESPETEVSVTTNSNTNLIDLAEGQIAKPFNEVEVSESFYEVEDPIDDEVEDEFIEYEDEYEEVYDEEEESEESDPGLDMSTILAAAPLTFGGTEVPEIRDQLLKEAQEFVTYSQAGPKEELIEESAEQEDAVEQEDAMEDEEVDYAVEYEDDDVYDDVYDENSSEESEESEDSDPGTSMDAIFAAAPLTFGVTDKPEIQEQLMIDAKEFVEMQRSLSTAPVIEDEESDENPSSEEETIDIQSECMEESEIEIVISSRERLLQLIEKLASYENEIELDLKAENDFIARLQLKTIAMLEESL